jgi:hypothetical protein
LVKVGDARLPTLSFGEVYVFVVALPAGTVQSRLDFGEKELVKDFTSLLSHVGSALLIVVVNILSQE